MSVTRRLSTLVAAAVLAGCAVDTPHGTPVPGEARLLSAEREGSPLYVALGDSTVEGIGASSPAKHYVGQLHARLRAIYPRARLKNLGVGGATAVEVLNRQLPRAVLLRPDLVTLSVGPNDITGRRDRKDYARDIEAILRTLTHRTTAVVVVNLIPDLTVTPRFKGKDIEVLVRQRVIAFNEILRDQARAYGAEVVDLYVPSQEEVPWHPELISADRYHPSDAGYARWADLMWVGIQARIAR